ncbi:MAG TPA: tripartite tricarboxylate transporter substrate binding protein [Burkholderiales bacterium]|nr:tripartite tricarboxylate transporter substrate binding protein [Burkholderiales bacterium]
MRKRAGIGLLLGAMLAAACSGSFSAQDYPTRPVRLVAASAPGGTSDILARLLAQALTQELGQSFVVENRSGASGIIGTEFVAKSRPDGYTLLLIQPSLTINPSMFATLPYDATRDFAPVTIVVDVPQVLSAHPLLPVRSLKELVALAKAKPGALTIGSPGVGTHPHLTSELLQQQAGIRLQQVVYKGIGPAFIALRSGEVTLALSALSSALPHVQAGKIRPLAVTTSRRVSVLPEVPTVAESALPGFESSQWFGVLAPAGTPLPIIERLHQAITRVCRSAEVKEKLAAMGMEPVNSTPQRFAEVIKEEIGRWAQVIKAAGIAPR